MNFSYEIGGKKRQCYYGRYTQKMTMYDENGECVRSPIIVGENGKRYFIVDGEKVMFDNFICPTPNELIDILASYDKPTYNDLSNSISQVLMKHGVDSLSIMIRDPKDDGRWAEYRFAEAADFPLEDAFTIDVHPVNKADGNVSFADSRYLFGWAAALVESSAHYKIVSNEKAPA